MSALKKKKIFAECLNSSMKEADRKRVYTDLRLKTPTTKYFFFFCTDFFPHRLLYVTPELIATEGFKSQLHALNNRGLLNCFAIDEVRSNFRFILTTVGTLYFQMGSRIPTAIQKSLCFKITVCSCACNCPDGNRNKKVPPFFFFRF